MVRSLYVTNAIPVLLPVWIRFIIVAATLICTIGHDVHLGVHSHMAGTGQKGLLAPIASPVVVPKVDLSEVMPDSHTEAARANSALQALAHDLRRKANASSLFMHSNGPADVASSGPPPPKKKMDGLREFDPLEAALVAYAVSHGGHCPEKGLPYLEEAVPAGYEFGQGCYYKNTCECPPMLFFKGYECATGGRFGMGGDDILAAPLVGALGFCRVDILTIIIPFVLTIGIVCLCCSTGERKHVDIHHLSDLSSDSSDADHHNHHHKKKKKSKGGLGLPPGWSTGTDPKTGKTYYFNAVTKVTQWTSPMEALEGTQLPAGWTSGTDPGSGRVYYVNSATQVTQWEHPGLEA